MGVNETVTALTGRQLNTKFDRSVNKQPSDRRVGQCVLRLVARCDRRANVGINIINNKIQGLCDIHHLTHEIGNIGMGSKEQVMQNHVEGTEDCQPLFMLGQVLYRYYADLQRQSCPVTLQVFDMMGCHDGCGWISGISGISGRVVQARAA